MSENQKFFAIMFIWIPILLWVLGHEYKDKKKG